MEATTVIQTKPARREYRLDNDNISVIDAPFQVSDVSLTHEHKDNRYTVKFAGHVLSSGNRPQNRVFYWKVYNHLSELGFQSVTDGRTTMFG